MRFSAAAAVLHLTRIVEEKRSQESSAAFSTGCLVLFPDEGKDGRNYERPHGKPVNPE
jgi:hypothetical protein